MHRSELSPERDLSIAVIGAGGTGSHALQSLAAIERALVELGRTAPITVDVFDGDRVSASNVGRQNFYPADVGLPKAKVLVNRFNLCMGTNWRAHETMVTRRYALNHHVVISCVDTRHARREILEAMRTGRKECGYWLDFGNGRDFGQAVLGQVRRGNAALNPYRLPHLGDLLPEALDATQQQDDEGPSCSLAEALARQSLFVNRAVVVPGMTMLWELLRYGKLDKHAAFVNLTSGSMSSLQVDPSAWKRFGYQPETTKTGA